MTDENPANTIITLRPEGYFHVIISGYLDDVALANHVKQLMTHEQFFPDALAIYDIRQADESGMNAENADRFYETNRDVLAARRNIMTTIVVRDRVQYAIARQFFSFWEDDRYQLLFSLEEAEAAVAEHLKGNQS